MIPLKNICVLDKKVKSWRETNFFVKDINDIIIEDKVLSDRVKHFFHLFFNFDFLCPAIIVNENKVELKYDYESNFVRFVIDNIDINFFYGIIGKPTKGGTITDFNKQLKVLTKFLYQNINTIKMNQV